MKSGPLGSQQRGLLLVTWQWYVLLSLRSTDSSQRSACARDRGTQSWLAMCYMYDLCIHNEAVICMRN